MRGLRIDGVHHLALGHQILAQDDNPRPFRDAAENKAFGGVVDQVDGDEFDLVVRGYDPHAEIALLIQRHHGTRQTDSLDGIGSEPDLGGHPAGDRVIGVPGHHLQRKRPGFRGRFTADEADRPFDGFAVDEGDFRLAADRDQMALAFRNLAGSDDRIEREKGRHRLTGRRPASFLHGDAIDHAVKGRTHLEPVEFGLRRFELRTRGSQRRTGVVGLGFRGNTPADQLLGIVGFVLPLLQQGLCGIHSGFLVRTVQRQDHLARIHPVALLDGEICDHTGNTGGERGLLVCLGHPGNADDPVMLDEIGAGYRHRMLSGLRLPRGGLGHGGTGLGRCLILVSGTADRCELARGDPGCRNGQNHERGQTMKSHARHVLPPLWRSADPPRCAAPQAKSLFSQCAKRHHLRHTLYRDFRHC